MRRPGIFLSLLIAPFFLFSQNVDSLIQIYKTARIDTVKIKTAFLISESYFKTNPYNAQTYINEALRLALRINNKPLEATCYMKMGSFYKRIDVFDTSIVFYKKARAIFYMRKEYNNEAKAAFNIATNKSSLGLTDESLHELDSLSKYFEKEKNFDFVGKCYSNMADVYDTKGKYDKATERLFKAIAIFEKGNEKDAKARALNELANVFRQQGYYKKALSYAMEGLKIREEAGNKLSMGTSYTTLGNIYGEMNEPKNAIKYMRLSYKVYEDMSMESGIAVVCNNLGLMYEDVNNDSAIYYFKKSIDIKRKYAGSEGIEPSLINLAWTYMLKAEASNSKSEYKKALPLLFESIKRCKETGNQASLRNSYYVTGQCFNEMGEYKTAYQYHDSSKVLSDSILSVESSKEISEMEAIYQNDKKNLEINNLQKERSLQSEEIKRQNLYKVFYAIGFILMLSLSVVAYRSYSRKKRDNKLISNQKTLVEEKQKEILGSITYARYLQNAILPPLSLVKQYLPQSFIIYQPKDIVAGDFYWMNKLNENELLIAAADCTGHGVPGAMVSVVCSNALNRAVKEFKITEPGKILDKVRELVLETFSKSESEVKDGMDISLCSIEKKNEKVKIQWSGANNPLWYIQNKEFKEITPDKQSIGKTDKPTPFSTHTIELNKGDSLFLFTDGFADQFGGSAGKKFKYKQFKDLLVTTSENDLEAQKEEIIKIFEDWKGKLEQVDDVCLIGIRF